MRFCFCCDTVFPLQDIWLDLLVFYIYWSSDYNPSEGQYIETKLCKNSGGNPDDTDELGQDETTHTIDTAAQGLHKNTKIISSFFV